MKAFILYLFYGARQLFLESISIMPYIIIFVLGILFSVYMLHRFGEFKKSTMIVVMIVCIFIGIGIIRNTLKLSYMFKDINNPTQQAALQEEL